MLTLEEIQEILKDRNLSEIARRTKLDYATVYKAAQCKNVSYRTVKMLSDYLQGKVQIVNEDKGA